MLSFLDGNKRYNDTIGNNEFGLFHSTIPFPHSRYNTTRVASKESQLLERLERFIQSNYIHIHICIHHPSLRLPKEGGIVG
mmetsp:Transcript_24896/g.54639  ORF Transcript_24896/g.54639 Transcript_24896/m.54639 type:complete len:81 (-) Transcript_24896:138-380(-)